MSTVLLLSFQGIAFIPFLGVTVPVGNLIGAFPDYGFNIKSICLRFAVITAIINLVSTVLWIV
jgi:hypothetical protein